ncbi:pyruvate dehydrogenase E1 component alpha subunit, partial [Phenoliferia sp. Uapishka_3]
MMNRALRASTSTLRTVSARATPSLVAARRPSLAVAAPVIAARSLQTSADATSLVGTLPESKTETFKIALHPEYFQTHLCDTPSLEFETTKEKLVTMYSQMVSMRRMEMAADQKLIRGFCHLAIGQEAVSVGMHTSLKKDDKIITAYRCHPFAVLRGGTIKGVIAELLGRVDGTSSPQRSFFAFAHKSFQHKDLIISPLCNSFFGGNGIVGAQVPLGAGIAFAQQYLGQDKDHATFAMYGDGASNQGQVFEAYNMAKLWNLPCVFVCENNLYGMGTSAQRSSMNTKYYTRGDVIPGLQVNGMDVLAVAQAVKYAKDWTQSGKGPLILEMVTYRYGGHSMSDPGTTYRTREEIQHMRSSNDPITGLKNNILAWGVMEESELKAIDKAARQEVEIAVEEAKKSPEPSQETDMYTDIYYKGTNPMYMRGRESQEASGSSSESTYYPPSSAPGFQRSWDTEQDLLEYSFGISSIFDQPPICHAERSSTYTDHSSHIWSPPPPTSWLQPTSSSYPQLPTPVASNRSASSNEVPRAREETFSSFPSFPSGSTSTSTPTSTSTLASPETEDFALDPEEPGPSTGVRKRGSLTSHQDDDRPKRKRKPTKTKYDPMPSQSRRLRKMGDSTHARPGSANVAFTAIRMGNRSVFAASLH